MVDEKPLEVEKSKDSILERCCKVKPYIGCEKITDFLKSK